MMRRFRSRHGEASRHTIGRQFHTGVTIALTINRARPALTLRGPVGAGAPLAMMVRGGPPPGGEWRLMR